MIPAPTTPAQVGTKKRGLRERLAPVEWRILSMLIDAYPNR